jgi:hypothetical protein
MIDAGLAFAPAIALVMTVLLAALYINLGLPFRGLHAFVTVAAGTWLGGQLLAPVGPLLWDVPWLSFVISGLVAATLYLTLQVTSRYMTMAIVAQLDSLAATRRAIRSSLSSSGEMERVTQPQGESRLEVSKA